jgi:hypothetical protein
LELDLVCDKEQEVTFTKLFKKVNRVDVCTENSVLAAPISEIEEEFGDPSIGKMLIYSKTHNKLGRVLSRRYVNSAQINDGPLRLVDDTLLPDHLSTFPNGTKKNRVLFLTPHCDEPYLAAALLHKVIGDQVFVHSLTFEFKDLKKNVIRAYQTLGLEKNDYSLGSLSENYLINEIDIIKEIIRDLLREFKPTVVYSVFPNDSHFDHMAAAQAAREIILNESKADLMYGYTIVTKNNNPIIFPLFDRWIYEKILQAFGKEGFGKIFLKFLPFLKWYLQTHSGPILRMIGSEKLSTNIYSLPLEAERISNYIIPSCKKASIL